jgi:hypothetical protein
MHMTLTSPTYPLSALWCEFFWDSYVCWPVGMQRAWGRPGQALARHVKRREEEEVYALWSST